MDILGDLNLILLRKYSQEKRKEIDVKNVFIL
jgi:hypothetical protein